LLSWPESIDSPNGPMVENAYQYAVCVLNGRSFVCDPHATNPLSSKPIANRTLSPKENVRIRDDVSPHRRPLNDWLTP
jgi:hypothetical protein